MIRLALVRRSGPIFRRGIFPLIGGGHTTLPLVYAGTLRLIGRSDLAHHTRGTLAMLTRDHPFTWNRS
jgi:hypothetical protein